nr:putative reverse transcriptase domain-containing protein [Tanacetum cinerariifolium]
IDDILIYSKMKEEHEIHLGLILDLLKKQKLYAKFSMCEFWLQEVQFVGHVVNSDGIHVDLGKIEAVKDWEALKSPMKVHSFLGLAGNYRQFNDKLCNSPVLALPDGLEDIMIELFSDYDYEIRYHPGKANVVADALSKKERIKPRRVRAINMAIRSSIKKIDARCIRDTFGYEYVRLTTLQTDGESWCTIQILKDTLKACVIDFEISWDIHLPLAEFSGVVRFGKKEKLAPSVHDTFHVSNLKKFLAGPTLHVPLEEIHVDAKLNFMEELEENLEREIKKLKRSRIFIVKIGYRANDS